MRAVVQRVTSGRVTIAGQTVGQIGRGLVILLGVAQGDNEEGAAYLARKIANLRIFEDENDKLNLSVLDVGGAALAVSQFTLYADCRKGMRPSFGQAAPADEAKALYEQFVRLLREQGLTVETGVFQADMLVEIANDGPVTIIIDSK